MAGLPSLESARSLRMDSFSLTLASKRILITGGLGFIGSHTAVLFVEAGAVVTLIDNLCNSYLEVLERMKEILKEKSKQLRFRQMDVRDTEALTALCEDEQFDAVIHFAALKAVGESVAKPLEYYKNNLGCTMSLLEAMREAKLKNMVFSSSCTVYGVPERVPIDEQCPVHAVSPYGRTKLYIEEMLKDVAAADSSFNFIILRYFNPVAAHPSSLIGEHPIGVPQNLMPFVQQVATGKRPVLKVFGADYGTRDGTAIRDYIHIMDLAEAHVAALTRLLDPTKKKLGCKPINIGTGKGSTVLEMVAGMEKACGHAIPYELAPRRPGDTEAVWAATDVAWEELGWKSHLDIDHMCQDQWRWAQRFPNGYE